ncbi:CPBP family intramembrane glutamic endopeptidase [Actibacterium sp. 188UL27-1]|uniref:CPBP family intramembrane glutamic endopeptidase n=1 Tax=Actibacterium sp. 188UL27-1 TaxID=2786961 RepID=UPI00195C35DB|nr:CPBP family intramembrane glutamic endopeptidase [Actibacterium sp. 188UL27-1]
MSYGPHQQFVRPAAEKGELWRIPVVLIVTFLGGIFFARLVLDALLLPLAPDLYNAMAVADVQVTPSPAFTLANLAMFMVFAVSFGFITRLLHLRSLLSMLGPLEQAWIDFRAVLIWAGAVYLVVGILSPTGDLTLQRNSVTAVTWVLLLPLTSVALLIQTGTEEVVFRGYLQQQLGARFRSPWLWLVAPSLAFGLLHWFNEPGPNAWFIVVLVTLSGLSYADLTARTGTMGAAWALHLVNNFFAIAVVSVNDDWGGLALYVFDLDWSVPQPLSLFVVEAVWVLCGWLAARVAVRA